MKNITIVGIGFCVSGASRSTAPFAHAPVDFELPDVRATGTPSSTVEVLHFSGDPYLHTPKPRLRLAVSSATYYPVAHVAHKPFRRLNYFHESIHERFISFLGLRYNHSDKACKIQH